MNNIKKNTVMCSMFQSKKRTIKKCGDFTESRNIKYFPVRGVRVVRESQLDVLKHF